MMNFNTIKTMCSNLTGMMCDGAKQGCALKVYSGVSAAVQAALLSMKGIKTHNDGIIEEDIEKTIRNVFLSAPIILPKKPQHFGLTAMKTDCLQTIIKKFRRCGLNQVPHIHKVNIFI